MYLHLNPKANCLFMNELVCNKSCITMYCSKIYKMVYYDNNIKS